MTHAAGEEGFTLIELLISLALFGLISLAGLSLVDSVLGIEERTDGRLDRIADIRRMSYLVGADLEQIDPGPIAGGGETIDFRRHGYGLGGVAVPVRYSLDDHVLTRVVGGGTAQPLLDGVAAARWRFYAPGAGWTERWPPTPEQKAIWPAAAELSLTLTAAQGGSGGSFRRVVALPARP